MAPKLSIGMPRCRWCRRVAWLIQAGQMEGRSPGEAEKGAALQHRWKYQLHASGTLLTGSPPT